MRAVRWGVLVTSSSKHPQDYRAIIIIAVLVALAINGAVIGWAFWLAAQRADVTLSEPLLEGLTALCPGETLDYRYTLSVSKAASIDLHTSVERVVPYDRVSYTRLQQFEFDEEAKLEIIRHWILPSTYLDPASGTEVAWEPGEYVQRTSANIVGRSEVSSIKVPFTIREGCAPEALLRKAKGG